MANYSGPKTTRCLASHRNDGNCSHNNFLKSTASSYPTALRCARCDKRDASDSENSNYNKTSCCSRISHTTQNFNFDTSNLYDFQKRHDEAQTYRVYSKDFCENTHKCSLRESAENSQTRNVCCGTNVECICKGIQTNTNDIENYDEQKCSEKIDGMSSRKNQPTQTDGADDYYMAILKNSSSELPQKVAPSFGEDTYFIHLKRKGSENNSEIFEREILLNNNSSHCSGKQGRISGGKQVTFKQTHYTSSSVSTESEQHLRRKRYRKKSVSNGLTKLKESFSHEYNYRRKYTSTSTDS